MLSVMNCPPDDVVIEALRDRSPDDLEARWLVAWIAGRLGAASVQRNADQLVERFEREDSAFVVAAARPAIERLDPRRQTIVLSAIAQHGLAKVAYIIAESQPGGVDRLLARLRESGARDAEREVLSLRRRDEERTRR
ncbi:hypothetical protein AMOR_14270 [Anaeromyxobacter oryzae]|uniref:HEAT repeat domain-containing protein n=2 Tax=Anaeromyxobacter oryzae TaxID=2918170 RepID=A0ABN6MPV2_9BACT|nr:hypothetical protein AMOR_14270 [Anaeromyxobacter oryzae]